jgi:hypothetical protein
MPSTCAARQRGEGGRRRHTHLLLEGRHPALARRGHAHGRRGRLQAAHLVCACLLGAGCAVAEALLLVLCLANKRAVSSGRASTRGRRRTRIAVSLSLPLAIVSGKSWEGY